MGALSPEVASPLVNGLNNIPRTGKGALRCRQQARPPTGQYQRSSTSTAPAPKSLGRSGSEIQKGSHGRPPSTIAHSSAAGSFDAIPDKSVSEPSTKSADTETGEIYLIALFSLLHLEMDTPYVQAVGNATFTQAVLNVINIVTGVGLLSVPFALKRAGWAGLGILWVLGFIMNYTGKILGECHEFVCERMQREGKGGAVIGYEDIGAEAFGGLGRAIVSASMYIELLGTCALLFILEGDNLFQLLGPRYAPDAATYMLLAALVMIPTVWLPDLKALSGLGVVGVAATLTVTAAIAYTLISGSFPPGAATSAANWASMPAVFGILAFVYSGHGVFPSVRASMKEPKKYPKVLNVAYLVVGGLCTFIGATGYYMYGNAARDLVTFNLPAGLLATLCASVILVNPIAKLAITMDPVGVAANTWAAGIIQGVPAGVRRFIVRTLLACGCLAAARFVPFLAFFMSLIGSFLTIAVSVILPVSVHLKIFQGKLSKQRLVWNWLVIAIGAVVALSGTSASVKALLASTSAA